MKKLLLLFAVLFAGISFSQIIPYNVNKKKFPLGDEFQKLMPVALGNWTRYSFHDYLPGLETGHVFYKKDNRQIYVVFGKAVSQNDLKNIWTKLYDEATIGKEIQIKQKNTGSSNSKFLLMQNPKNYYFAWTRNLYYFSIQTKNKPDADEFMKLFPY
jgi:hypothetical protein